MRPLLTTLAKVRAAAILGFALLAACATGLPDSRITTPPFATGWTVAVAAREPGELSQPVPSMAIEAAHELAEESIGTGIQVQYGATAADLSRIGITIEEAELAVLRAPDWSPGPILTHGLARHAFLARSPTIAEATARYYAVGSRFGQVENLTRLVRLIDAFAEDLRTGATTPQVRPAGPPWPPLGMDALRSRTIAAEVRMGEARFEQSVLEALVLFEEAYAGLVYAEAATGVWRAQVVLGRVLVASIRSSYRAGQSDMAELLWAEARLDEWRVSHSNSEEAAQAARTMLAATLDLPLTALTTVEVVRDETPPSVEARSEALERASDGPALRVARAMKERAELMEQLVERRFLPNLSPGIARAGSHGEVPRPMLPMAFAGGAPYLTEIRLVRQAAAAALHGAERAVPAEAEARWARASSAIRRLRLVFDTNLRRAARSAELAQDAYRAGGMSYRELDYLLSEHLRAQLTHHELRREAAVALAHLRAITGLDLTRRAASQIHQPDSEERYP